MFPLNNYKYNGVAVPIVRDKPTMYAAKNAGKIAMALIVSYGVWGIIGLNAWIATLRKGILYYWYQGIFISCLAIFFWIYMHRKEHAGRQLNILVYGLLAGYLSSGIAICLWPLLAPNGWDRFLHMRWDLSQLPFDALISGGCLNGLIMSFVIFLLDWMLDLYYKQEKS